MFSLEKIFSMDIFSQWIICSHRINFKNLLFLKLHSWKPGCVKEYQLVCQPWIGLNGWQLVEEIEQRRINSELQSTRQWTRLCAAAE